MSLRTWWRRDSAGLVPRAVFVGATKRWRVEELEHWIEAKCPSRQDWETMEKAKWHPSEKNSTR